MTEDEAKTKWCPHVVASHTDPRQAPSQYEREAGVSSPFRHNCIASACMAWRLQEAPRETLRNYVDARTVEPKPGLGGRIYPDGWQYAHTDVDRDGRKFDLLHRIAEDTASCGYCGLAGFPTA